ncbi:MAG TPA: hypothetical protein V6D10_22130 [Trichocoleus sp.]|jgi:hypothetical protein
MLPIIVHEHTIHPFNYYFQGDICQGMSFHKKLYRLLHSFEVEQQLYAQKFACSFAQCREIIVTVSEQHYRVWIDLSSEAKAQTQSSKRVKQQEALLYDPV